METVICVLGMHRSGTSLVAGMLDLMGVDFGPEGHLLPPEPDNPLGFWEHRSIVELNDELLSVLGGTWRDPPVLAPGFEDDPALAELRRRAEALVERDFGRSAVWGWKDPRACLTLPFWRRVMPPMRVVVCVRNPLDAARSLERRDGISVEEAGDLWFAYTAAALANTSEEERLIVPYEDLMEDRGPWLDRLARSLGLEGALESDAVREKAVRLVRPGLRHERSTRSEAIRDPELPFHTKALYLLAQRGASHGDSLHAIVASASTAAQRQTRLHRALDEAGQRRAAAEGELAALRSSRTFRYTAPLRAAYARLRAWLARR